MNIIKLEKDNPIFSRLLNPPSCLYALGDISLLQYSSIAIVGSRNPTPYGISMCKHFSKFLTKKGFVIISGLALGIDGIAHKTCIESGGKTIAILRLRISSYLSC